VHSFEVGDLLPAVLLTLPKILKKVSHLNTVKQGFPALHQRQHTHKSIPQLSSASSTLAPSLLSSAASS
jgi:hypothetical protein